MKQVIIILLIFGIPMLTARFITMFRGIFDLYHDSNLNLRDRLEDN